MADIFIVKLRVRFAAMLSLVLTLLGGLATWHFRNQVEFEPDNSKFLLSAVVTGAFAVVTVGLFLFYLVAQFVVNPSRKVADRIDSVPWWILKVLLVVLVIGAAGYFVVRYRNFAEDEFTLLRKGKLDALQTRMEARPVLLEQKGAGGLTLTQVAYQEGHPDALRLLIGLGAQTAGLDPSGGSPVIASMLNLPMLSTLLDCGLDPSSKDADGTPAIHYAVRMPTTEVLEMLIDAGADADGRNGIYRTALMQCIETDNYPMAEILIKKGADLDAFDQRGDTALHIAVRRRSEVGINLLIENKADAAVFNFIHMTPLHIAAQAGQDNLVQLLAGYLENIDLVDEIDTTPFELALTNRKYDTATLLVESGADVNRVMVDGKTLMHHSIDRKEYAITRFLLRAGADANIPDKEGRTVLDLCKTKELQGLVEMIEGVPGSDTLQAVEN